MKIKISVFFILMAVTFYSGMLLAGENRVDYLDKVQKEGRFPKGWRAWPLQASDAAKVYHINIEDGKNYIAAQDDKNLSKQIFSNFRWDVVKYPYLNWKWRAKVLPKGANESDDAKNDSACGIYVVVGKYKGHALKYAWSSSLPVGEIVTRRDGNLKIIIADAGNKNLNKWTYHSINVAEEYTKAFGRALKKDPSGVGILTDGNATETEAACDYADFIISDKPMY
ncbi:MAG: DUF3047 domain-containing protein [Pseudomonadota bacterium]